MVTVVGFKGKSSVRYLGGATGGSCEVWLYSICFYTLNKWGINLLKWLIKENSNIFSVYLRG